MVVMYMTCKNTTGWVRKLTWAIVPAAHPPSQAEGKNTSTGYPP